MGIDMNSIEKTSTFSCINFKDFFGTLVMVDIFLCFPSTESVLDNGMTYLNVSGSSRVKLLSINVYKNSTKWRLHSEFSHQGGNQERNYTLTFGITSRLFK